jgi:hypothetical protein
MIFRNNNIRKISFIDKEAKTVDDIRKTINLPATF